MQNNKWRLLQLFADGGDGGSSGGEGGGAAETGVSGADAGHQRLRDLGVPEHKIRKNRAYKASEAAVVSNASMQTATQQTEPEQAAAATEPTEGTVGKRLTWEEIKSDPEYSEQISKMMRERLKKSKGAEETLAKMTPALENLAKSYGLDTSNLDYSALSEKILGDNGLYRDKALELGVDEDTARKLEQFDLMQQRQKRTEETNQKEAAMQQHYSNLRQQGEAMKAKYPQFDLDAEFKNPTFMRLTAPGVNIPVEDAYFLVHRKEIEKAALAEAAKQTTKNIANAMRSGTMRPQENGAASAAPSVSTFSYKNASPQQREELKKRIHAAAARGEKVYPGQ